MVHSLKISNKFKLIQNNFRWWAFALILRFLSSLTFSHWFHPDEWCQTLEPAHLIAHGLGIHSQEIGLHLRNLTWPYLLSLIIKWTHFISPLSIDLRIFNVNFLCGLLDLLILWGWMKLFDSELVPAPRGKVRNLSIAMLLLPWFTLYETINPRAEHLSEIALWTTFGLIATEAWILAGVGCVAIFAFRYPSILLSFGIGLGLLISTFYKKSNQENAYREFGKFLIGITLGLILFGIADYSFYGRPWESFWMYLQYNIFTGSSSLSFGKQGIEAYAEFFHWNWATYPLLLPLGIILSMGSLYGLWEGLKKLRPWAFCLIIYLIGHLLVPHKEPRFLIPIEILLRWSSIYGCVIAFEKTKALQKKIPHLKTMAFSILIFSFIANALVFLHTLRADLWKSRGTYRELGSHLKAVPQVCAILTVDQIQSILIPFSDPRVFPDPAVGFINLEIDPLAVSWMEHNPTCSAQSRILVHVQKLDAQWITEGCSLLPSGIMRVLPEKWASWAVQKKWVGGPWYHCPAATLTHFSRQKTEFHYSHSFGKIDSLPPLGITPEALQKMGRQTSPPPRDAVLPGLQ